jgi:sirohydrochlorin ferrochelatase
VSFLAPVIMEGLAPVAAPDLPRLRFPALARSGVRAPRVLVAHGSADPRAAVATRALAAAVGAIPSYLDHAGPRPGNVLGDVERAGHRSAVLVPLLLTAAYHGRVDIPGVLAAARADGLTLDVAVTEALGPVRGAVPVELLNGLRRLLPAGRLDGVVLAAAGTRDAAARATIDLAAARLGAMLGVPCVAGYASAAHPTPGEAVAALRARGARRVALSAYFLAPGRLYDAAVRSAGAAGAIVAAPPLSAAPDLVRLVNRRITETTATATATAAAAA